jgi:hypothetical protein
MSTNQGVFQVHRATLRFDVREDRICLACEGTEDAKTALWLTARLSGALVDYLLNLSLQAPTSLEGGCGEHQEPKMNGDVGLHTIEPVSIDASSDSLVAIAIDIVEGQTELNLSFRDASSSNKVQLVLRHDQIAQWLEGLKNCYRQADWPMAVWKAGDLSRPHDGLRENVTLH